MLSLDGGDVYGFVFVPLVRRRLTHDKLEWIGAHSPTTLLPKIPVHLCANLSTGLFAIERCGSKKDSSDLPPALVLLLSSTMRYSSGARNYPWKTMITLNLTEIENHAEVGTKIAKGFTKVCLDEKHYHPEKFVLREVHYADEPKSLNYYLMDKDCVAILKRMYGGDNGYTKQELMEYGDLLTNVFGCEE